MALPRQPAPGSAGWWLRRRAAPERRPRRDGLSLDAIVDAALAVLREHGSDGLTMRRVADELGTGAASLYRHVAGREELVALVVDAVLGRMEPVAPSPAGGWRAEFETTARRFRGHLLAHIEVVPLIRSAQMLGPHSMAARETALRTLLDLGLAPGDAVAAYLAIVHFTVANVQLEARTGVDEQNRRADLESLFAAQDVDRLPHLVAHAGSLATVTGEAEFEFGLAALLDRIQALAG
ncbi:TetR/AcrR family transcriptional regulator [Blastococcus sp. CCUG 61487]|uniref:TetR/AcrR family transcriptional regulator n=1 Tax=Blastococcus sp. CCUG 61487 TaxID=1840703 RepID=UPI0010C048B5|nr:TetR/AcrR family transcriptional regulator [Blastococcus sp. CCUG 61487]TKJ34235.1 hypothetical protein A6V29_15335 [Blastococcus sp. CCUG 61487]